MYFLGKEHNPPHIHAIYGEHTAAITIETGEILDGALPPKALALVREWTSSHKGALVQMWETQKFQKLPPLD